MPDFSPTTFTFGKTISRNRAINNAQNIELAKQFSTDLDNARTATVAEVDKLTEVGTRVAAAGGDVEPIRAAAQKVSESFAVRLAGLQAQARAMGHPGLQIQSGAEFIEERLQLFDASVDAGAQTAVQTLEPEALSKVGFPEGSVVQKDSEGNFTLVFDPTDNPSALQERFDYLKNSGVDEGRAAAIVGGRLVVTFDPITRESRITDLAGDDVGDPLPIPDISEPVVPPGTDPTQAVGVSGIFFNAVNTLTDAIGLGVTFEGAQQATDALNLVQQTTKLLLQEAVPGRPAKDIREGLEKLTVPPNSLLKGEDRALSSFKQTKRLIDNEVSRMERMLEGEVSPTDRGTITRNLGGLKEMSRSHQDLIDGFGGVSQAALGAIDAALEAGDPELANAIMDAMQANDEGALAKLIGKDDGED